MNALPKREKPLRSRSARLVGDGERKAITARMKAEAHAAAGGACYVCQAAVPLSGPGVEYDHKLPLWLHGAHNVANIGPICPDPCHKSKTKSEAPVRAKVKRLRAREAGEKTAKQQIKSRGFDKSKSRRFDGSVVARRSAVDR